MQFAGLALTCHDAHETHAKEQDKDVSSCIHRAGSLFKTVRVPIAGSSGKIHVDDQVVERVY